MLLRRVLARPGPRVVLGLHLVLAIALCFVPLFAVLGFERAFATGLLSTPAAAALAVATHRALPEASAARVAWTAMILAVIALLPTLLAGLLVEAFAQPCSPADGLAFWVVGPVTQAAFGVALGAVVMRTPLARARPSLAVAALLLGALVLALHRLWAEPQIFVYSLPLGHWPGSIYDESLAPSVALLAHRALATAVAIALVALLQVGSDGRSRAIFLLSTLAAWALWSRGEELGFDRSRATIERALSRTVETPRWTLHVDPSIGAAQLERLRSEMSLRDVQLERFFGGRPSLHVHAYVYANDAQKHALMGAAGTQLARPWSGELHVGGFEVPHPALNHELAHVFAGELATGPLRVPARARVFVNLGLVEGVAVAADWPVRSGLTVHQWARAMRALGVAPDPREVVYPSGFWSQSSARAYTIAGSFVRFLVETRGIERLGRAYASNDFDAAYGVPIGELVEAWGHTIDALPLSEEQRVLAEQRFRAPSIFARACPHTTANLIQEASNDLARGEIDRALPNLTRAFGYDGGRTDVLLAGSKALAREARLDEARAWALRARDAPGITVRARASAVETLADLSWRAGDLEAAAAGYAEVRRSGLSEDAWRLETVKLEALTRTASVSEVLRGYLGGERSMEQAAALLAELAQAWPSDATVQYLYAKLLENVGLPELSAVRARVALDLGLPDRALTTEARRMEARGHLWGGDPERAARLFRAMATTSTETGAVLEATDWAERAELRPR